ncbi:MAG: hypothetical protein R3F59_18940 [Myxococcota bacterium]
MRTVWLCTLLLGCGAEEDAPPDCAADPVTWRCDIGPMIDTYCVSCHTGGAKGDFRRYAAVASRADQVACGVATAELRPATCGDDWPPAEQFPAGQGPHPTDEERAEIVDWVAAGAPQ